MTAGKHLEAAREGVEDYEYFAMLDRAIRKASAQGRTGPAVERHAGCWKIYRRVSVMRRATEVG